MSQQAMIKMFTAIIDKIDSQISIIHKGNYAALFNNNTEMLTVINPENNKYTAYTYDQCQLKKMPGIDSLTLDKDEKMFVLKLFKNKKEVMKIELDR